MKRITQQTKAIADRHIDAVKSGKFDDPSFDSVEELIALLKEGKTFSGVVKQIENRFMPIGTILIGNVLNCPSDNYRRYMYKGFKQLLDN